MGYRIRRPAIRILPERWAWVRGYKGTYKVSTFGRVKSVDRVIACGPQGQWTQAFYGRFLVASPDPHTRYPRVNLAHGKSRKYTTVSVHTLVCQAFHGPKPTDKHEVNHKDLNRTNNHVGNLEWNTRVENCRHAWDNGAFKDGRLPRPRA